MAVNYITGHNVAFEQTPCDEAAPKAAAIENAKTRRIFIDEEHEGREFLPIKQAGKVNWVSLFLNQIRIYY